MSAECCVCSVWLALEFTNIEIRKRDRTSQIEQIIHNRCICRLWGKKKKKGKMYSSSSTKFFSFASNQFEE